jgi:hypothetical protein
MAALTAQPAQKGAFQQIDIQPVGLRPPMLARHLHAGGMDDIGLDAARLQPAGEPEAVPPGFVGNRDPVNRPTALNCFVPSALQQAQQRLGIRHEFLQRVPLDAGHNRTPSRPAWLISIKAINVLSWSRAASDLLNACPGAGRGHSAAAWGTSSVLLQRRLCLRLAARPIPS